MTSWFNISGTLSAFRLLRDPSLCLPHYTISTFNQLPVPLKISIRDEKESDIRAVVLDKDNCFSVPHENQVFEAYKEKFQSLRKAYPGSKLIIVSNTAGTAGDAGREQAKLLERNTGVHVLLHNTKKPGCHDDIMQYFRNNPDSGVKSPSQVAIVGDRLLTDIFMANSMGSYGVWVRDGVKSPSFLARVESRLASYLFSRGYCPPNPQNIFESG